MDVKVIEKKKYMFQFLAASLEKNKTGIGLNQSLLSEMKVHFFSVEELLSRYFPDISSKLFYFARLPFHLMLFTEWENTQQKFIKIINSTAINSEFHSFFWKLCLEFTGSWIMQHF
jgi:hypothetical protein